MIFFFFFLLIVVVVVVVVVVTVDARVFVFKVSFVNNSRVYKRLVLHKLIIYHNHLCFIMRFVETLYKYILQLGLKLKRDGN